MGGMGEGILSDRLRAAATLHVRVIRTPGADFAAEVTDDDGTRLALAATVHPAADWRGAGHAVELVCADTGRPMITVLDRADLGLGAGEVLDDGALPLGVVVPGAPRSSSSTSAPGSRCAPDTSPRANSWRCRAD